MKAFFAYCAALVLLCATACGGTGSEASHASSKHTGSTTSSADASAKFPVTIHHGQGTVTIPSQPRRVVALGAADVQIAQALGAHIVGAAANDYAKDHQWPGVEPALKPSVTMLSWTKPSIEKIAALKPDLILITTAQPGYSQNYAKLAKLAPTISYVKGILEDSGTDLTHLLGKALGATDRANRLIRHSAQLSADFTREHPELAGKKIAFGQYVSGSLYLVVAPDSPSVTFFESIRMKLPAEVAKLPVQAPPGVSQISNERVSILDSADYVVLGVAEPDAKLDNPLMARTRPAKTGHLRLIGFNEANVLLAPNPATTGTMLKIVAKSLTPGTDR